MKYKLLCSHKSQRTRREVNPKWKEHEKWNSYPKNDWYSEERNILVLWIFFELEDWRLAKQILNMNNERKQKNHNTTLYGTNLN